MSVLRFENVSKQYPGGHAALEDVSFEVAEGEMLFVTGHSGAGKSTLLKLIHLSERPSRGAVVFGGRNLLKVRGGRIPLHRREVGAVYQDHRLLTDRTVMENVSLPLILRGDRRGDIGKRVREVLARQGVELLIVDLVGYDIHLDVSFLMIDRDLAILNPMGLPYSFLEELKSRGIRWIETDPADDGWIVNSLAIAPGKVLMPEGATNRTLDRLAAADVSWTTLRYAAVQKNGGGLHCSTTPLIRDPV